MGRKTGKWKEHVLKKVEIVVVTLQHTYYLFSYFSALQDNGVYKLMVIVSKEPYSQSFKAHIRYLWNHTKDENFLVKVLQNPALAMGEHEPEWKFTQVIDLILISK